MEPLKTNKFDAFVLSSADEKKSQEVFTQMLKETPLPDDELLPNLGIYLTSKTLSRVLFFQHLYKEILHTHGVVMEFGVRWGQTLSILSALRGIYEPFNRHRKLIGFDTFAGFRGVAKEDGDKCKCADGSFGVGEGYEEYLSSILQAQEKLNPMSHIQRFELVKGDATETIPKYFAAHPEAVVSMAILDFDIYQPTKVALQALKDRMPKGSVLVFDELSDEYFPGETIAVQEVFGLRNLRVQRLPITARISYAILE
jgi:hypothetical protein